MTSLDHEQISARLRSKAVRISTQEILLARIEQSAQEQDLSQPTNCKGYGRVHHFRIGAPHPWPANPLPIIPASYRLALDPTDVMTAQVFQIAACNWRCWYCFVPYNLLSANETRSGWFTAQELVDLYMCEPDRPLIIDCSGGQPDLSPEWLVWMMTALRKRGLDNAVYLWSDDNLSNDYFWRFLQPSERELVREYRLYGRVGCFKGFNEASFTFNTKADKTLFARQFKLFKRLVDFGIDTYAYATFTVPEAPSLTRDMGDFVDRLQVIHKNLPLRLVPLQIQPFGVVEPRLRETHRRSLAVQEEAVQAWNEELRMRFREDELLMSMPLVSLRTD
ncbi:hypothetical protein [Acidithrix ferrooxidans]|uniref:Radical SAM superfamily protein n=1 Tax=Acidithrix ferrooxidans TaxID=1280514 RepID=A0A0D8HJU1_9ACTN|nr:hypothetical protein [Acidithrix ferrooxidans]KJF18164.1 hypothetical protein AXFE_09090 [Acidithrix ferrooxidans]